MGEKRRMHTVPRGYLEPFATIKGRRTPAVWRYERTNREPVAIGIGDANVHKDIYAFEDDGGERTTAIEDLLVEIEGNFCNARLKVVSGAALTLDERIAISHFVAFQLSRTPRALQIHRDEFAHLMKQEVLAFAANAQQFHDAMRQHHQSAEECEADRQAILVGKWHYEADPFTGLHAMMNGAAELSQWVLFMHWTFHRSDGGYRYLTSDNPVTTSAIRMHEHQLGTETGVGFANPDVTLSLPITPLVSLVAHHSPHSLLAVKTTNDPDRRRSGCRGWRPLLKTLPATPDQVTIMNHATAMNADRYMFAGERDSRIEKFLDRHFFGHGGPVRRRDGKQIGTVS
jgi:Protein of unknown function (DUF4238)